MPSPERSAPEWPWATLSGAQPGTPSASAPTPCSTAAPNRRTPTGRARCHETDRNHERRPGRSDSCPRAHRHDRRHRCRAPGAGSRAGRGSGRGTRCPDVRAGARRPLGRVGHRGAHLCRRGCRPGVGRVAHRQNESNGPGPRCPARGVQAAPRRMRIRRTDRRQHALRQCDPALRGAVLTTCQTWRSRRSRVDSRHLDSEYDRNETVAILDRIRRLPGAQPTSSGAECQGITTEGAPTRFSWMTTSRCYGNHKWTTTRCKPVGPSESAVPAGSEVGLIGSGHSVDDGDIATLARVEAPQRQVEQLESTDLVARFAQYIGAVDLLGLDVLHQLAGTLFVVDPDPMDGPGIPVHLLGVRDGSQLPAVLRDRVHKDQGGANDRSEGWAIGDDLRLGYPHRMQEEFAMASRGGRPPEPSADLAACLLLREQRVSDRGDGLAHRVDPASSAMISSGPWYTSTSCCCLRVVGPVIRLTTIIRTRQTGAAMMGSALVGSQPPTMMTTNVIAPPSIPEVGRPP